ncbi:MAG: PAS/PAC sensor signal transduction histidine kinase [Parcubacteria group bacterium GW2011_GWA1_44_13]|uniref:histidine kinase n=1 Tax=Candidatus Nomurabacteria bacterium GW2011_GWB1_44_12 TaxID=1618748 RepID=A0A837IAU2_9BACT|nr:MAG: PAS/PAC sensor signal transduction histidine kinase [Candidatus Nomurabacteria bacterium GW2011_GWB1_44_12]KKT38575.1 MAG: PAS/PAC sensor signal transduction histidine kinase [Parcubacteria group bacterium GW2011_GWA1_44_13]
MSVALLDVINSLSFASWGVVIGSLFTALLSGVVYWQDFTKRSSKFFFLFGLINLVWGLVYAYFEGSLATSGVHAEITLLYATAAVVPPFLFLFLYVFSVEDSQLSKWKLLAFFSPYFAIVGLLVFYPGFIVSYQESYGETLGKMVFGKGFLLYAFYILAFIFVGVGLLVKKYRESAGIFKTAIRELLIAVGVASVTAVLMSLFSPIFASGGHDLFWIGHLAVILLIPLTTYILVKYNFWNIKIIATELFISIIVLVLITELFLASSLLDLFIKTVIAMLIIFSSSFLVASVKREIQSKERIVRLSQDLDLISKRLKVLDKKKSEFLSIASHHLRDPLTAIKGYASMLSEGSFGDLSRPVLEAIEKIFVSSGHLVTMISDFMDISRIESGDMNYNFKDVDMKKLFLILADEMKQSAEHSHLVFTATVDEGPSEDEEYVTVGDEGKLRQVVSNLIDNSIKYTPHGEISMLLYKSPDKKKIIFSLSDTGIGMSELTKEKIFKKFSRAEGVSKVYTEGTGLGLYVAKEIVKKHEGRIWAESKGEGHGSSFYVELEAKR